MVQKWDDSPPRGETQRHPLPAPLTPLVGREALVAAAVALLKEDGVRLLTLTGPGGVGKTRMAIGVAEHLVPFFADGVVFVPLAPLTDPAQVLFAVANHMAMTEWGSNPLTDLIHHLRDKRLLLVLDNFEHLLSAAPLLASLLTAVAGLNVVATSREPLHLYGEQEFPIPPLAVPPILPVARTSAGADAPIAHLTDAAAVTLLLQRAQAVRPDFRLTSENAPTIVELCRRLDGLPLALELAAARLKFASPQTLLAQIDQRLHWLASRNQGVPARQQTLRNAMEWSYQLLNEGEQHLFARLAIFTGGFTTIAAETICNADGDLPLSVAEGLQGLVDKSLLGQTFVQDSATFTFLETIRAYALEHLNARGEMSVLRERHALFFVAFAEEAEPHLWGATQEEWLARLRQAEVHWHAALTWTLAEPASDALALLGVRLAMALRRFWEIQGRFTEARLWLERAVSRRALLPLPAQNRLLNLLGSVTQFQGAFALARGYHQQALRLAEELNDLGLRSTTLQFLGMIAGRQGDYHEAERVLSHVVAIERERNNPIQLSVALNNLALVARELGDYARATTLLEESLGLKRARGDQLGIATTLANLGTLALLRGEIREAVAFQHESLVLRQRLGDQPGLAITLCNIAGLALAQEAWERATKLYAAADALLQQIHSRLSVDIEDSFTRNVATLREKLGEAAFATAWQTGRAMKIAEVVAYALTIPAVPVPPPPATLLRDKLPFALATLTAREIEVLRLVALGLSDAEVAATLVLSPRTVSTHLHRIYSKLDVPSRTAAARYATEHGLI
jgi:predicted ATPase/DNA-binding CsgD family transcriptional regulator